MAVVRNLLIRAGADFSAMRKQMAGAQKTVQDFGRRINKTMSAVGAALAGLGIGFGIKSAVKDAMEFEAAIGQINRLMGQSAGIFTNWAITQGKAFGMAQSEAIKYGAVYANLISGFSRGTEETMTRTQDLLKASAVVASSTGRTMEDVMERIRSGLLGNTEAIEDLGINVNVALIESTNAFRQFANGQSWQQLDFNAQQTIRYFAILEQAATKYGNELAQNTATKQAIFNAHLKDARLYLGQAFLPIYNAILPALTAMAQALATATRWLAAFVSALFGVKTSTSKQTNAIGGQTAAVTEMGDAYEKAGKQAKGAVAGFDQVNLVGGTSGASAGGSGGAGGTSVSTGGAVPVDTSALGGVGQAMDGVAAKAQEMAAKVKAAYGSLKDFISQNSDIIIAALAGVGAAFAVAFGVAKWGAIVQTVQRVGATIGAIIAGLSLPITLIVAAVGALVGAFVYFYRTNEQFRGFVDGILQGIADIAVWLWKNVLVPFGAWLGTALVAAWQAVGVGVKWVWDNVLVPFGKWLADVMPKAWEAVTKAAQWLWKNILVPFGDFLLWLWEEVLVPVGKVIGEALVIAFETVAEIAKEFWQKVIVPLGEALSEMLGPAIEAVSAVLEWLWDNALKPLGQGIKSTTMPIINKLIDVFEWLWKNILKPIANFVSSVFVTVFSTTFDSIGDLIGGLKDTFIGLMTFITGVFTGDWKKAWDGVKQIFKGVFDSLWTIVKHPLNLIIDGINGLIDGLNKIKFDFPDWVPGLGNKSFGINIPKIPKLAVGTNYVESDGLAYLHEGEAVVPKKYNPAAGGDFGGTDLRSVEILLSKMLRAIERTGNVNVMLSQTALTRAITEAMRVDQMRSGRAPTPT